MRSKMDALNYLASKKVSVFDLSHCSAKVLQIF